MTCRAPLSLAVIVLFAVGCAPDPKVVAQRTSTDVKSLIREAWLTAEGSNSWTTLDSSLLAMGVDAQTRATSTRVPPVSSVDTGMDTLNKRINRVFDDTNIVDRSGALTFQVRGVDVCSDDNGAVDASCADQIDRMKLFIRASGDLDLSLLVGEKKAEAFVVQIRAGSSIAVVADLEKSIAAVTALQQAQSGNTVTYNFTAKGQVEYRLQKNGPADFTLSASVLSPVTYEMTGSDGVTRKASIGAKSPVASIRVEGPAKKATLQYGAGELRYSGLLRDLFTSETTSSRPLEAFLAGAGASLIFEEGKTARLEGVGLGTGTSTLKSGNDVLLSVDFNRDHGRAVAATWEPSGQGFTLRFTPGLQLDAHVGLGVLESPTYVVAPEHKNATYSASFLAPGKSPAVEFLTKRDASGTAFVRLVEGELRLSVDDANVAPRSFAAPMCLSSSSGAGGNRYLESIVAGTCP